MAWPRSRVAGHRGKGPRAAADRSGRGRREIGKPCQSSKPLRFSCHADITPARHRAGDAIVAFGEGRWARVARYGLRTIPRVPLPRLDQLLELILVDDFGTQLLSPSELRAGVLAHDQVVCLLRHVVSDNAATLFDQHLDLLARMALEATGHDERQATQGRRPA